MTSRLTPIPLKPPKTEGGWFEEPGLIFADAHTHPDPKIGIPLYGPRSLGTSRHKSEVHVGFIGSAEAMESARRLYEHFAEGVSGDREYAPFPGCKRDL